ncbi:MAG: histidine kinase [Candidatus Krumholzibacteriota bacterium]|nr:histidine kinase [Candidatus Krumholzibacteriota bacterium]
MPSLSNEQLALINLLLRIAVMAGIISLVLGFRFVIDFLVRMTVSRAAQLKFFLLLSIFFVLGILVRKLSNQAAMDLSLEGALLAGLLGGVWIGSGTGLVIGLICFFMGEMAALPLYLVAGFTAGILRTWLGKRGDIWSFSLNPLLIIYNFFSSLARGKLDRNFIPFALCILFTLTRYQLLDRFYARHLLYGYPSRDWLFIAIDLVVIVYTIGVALKMTSNAGMEILLQEEERQLVHARLTTLRSQINPHFLFNTLNSIAALIRTDAEKAREMTRTLSSIFRKSLEDSTDIHSLAEEMKFLDDYLSIERVRFGDDKFRVIKELDPDSLEINVPSMLLQPLVENAIKHGISCLAEGGILRIVSRRRGPGVEIEIENDGPPTGALEIPRLVTRGMGLCNVIERLKIYTRGEGKFDLSSRPEGGAKITLYLPAIDERGGMVADQSIDC